MSTAVCNDVPALSGFKTPEGRWARLGPYYAMFPVAFAREVVGAFSQPGETVLDPFCGRGTAPYVAMVSGRGAVGCDLNPVAWVYACAKTDPDPSLEQTCSRVTQIAGAVRSRDRQPDDEFQTLAFCPQALGFIKAARRELRWRESRLDRTVAGLLLHYLHGKLGQCLSNQLRPTRAMGPDYSVRWWRQHNMTEPPDLDPGVFLRGRAEWRYSKGLPAHAGSARVALGDAAQHLPRMPAAADLVLTSPPYVGVTNYQLDNWLRLWALGGAARPDWSSQQKFRDATKYETMLTSVLNAARERAAPDAVWWLRVDARERTLSVARRVLDELLPGRDIYQRRSVPAKPTQTALYGDHRTKPGDIDLVYSTDGRMRRGVVDAFGLVRV